MRSDLTMDDPGDLAGLRLLAVLAACRHDGAVLLSAVWREWREGGFRIVTGSREVKAAHLRRDPRAGIVVCGPSPPYRGAGLRCRARLLAAGAAGAVKRIASGCPGLRAGAAYAGQAEDDLLIRLEPGGLRARGLRRRAGLRSVRAGKAAGRTQPGSLEGDQRAGDDDARRGSRSWTSGRLNTLACGFCFSRWRNPRTTGNQAELVADGITRVRA